jgi:putative transposase
MPRRARTLQSESYFHVINRSVRKAPLFERSKDYRDFLRILREGLERHPAPLIAYCVMSNHWHLVIGPVGTGVLSRLLHWVTTTHAVRFQKRRATCGQGPIYQGRFKSHPIETAGQLLRAIRYVERNALAANLVRRAEDWPWGSLADRQRSEQAVPLHGAMVLSSRSWLDLVNTNQPFEDGPLRDLAEEPGAGEGGEKRGRVGGRRRNHEADAHVERPKHLRVVKLARTLQPLEQGRNRPALAIK